MPAHDSLPQRVNHMQRVKRVLGVSLTRVNHW